MDPFTNETAEWTYGNDTEVHHYGYSRGIFVVRYVLLPIVFIFGMFGIVLTVVVLSRKNMCTSTNCYLLSLSISDLCFLIILSTLLIEEVMEPGTREYEMYVIYQTYAGYILNICLLASVFLAVVLAGERYIAICQPFMAHRLCTVTNAYITTAIVFTLSVLLRLCNFWEHSIQSDFDPSINKTWYYLEVTAFGSNSHYKKYYPYIIDVVISSIIPLFLLIVLNVRLILEVRRSTRYLHQNSMISRTVNSTAQREELQITVMLISIIVIFVMCQFPFVSYMAISAITKTESIILHDGFNLFKIIAQFMLALKSSLNFVIYCWFSEKFRATLRTLVCKSECSACLRKYDSRDNPGSTVYLSMQRLSINLRENSAIEPSHSIKS